MLQALQVPTRSIWPRRKHFFLEPNMQACNQPVQIHALGSLRVETAQAALHLDSARSRKPRELLEALIACGPRGIGQRRLCEALWPDSEGDAAYRALITTVYRLRRWIASREAIRFASGHLALCSDVCAVDAWQFEQYICADRCGCMSDSTLALYQGQLLPSSDAPLVIEARERLRHRFVKAVQQSAPQVERDQGLGAAIDLVERAIEVDVSSEALHRALIVLHVRQGQTLEAAGAYQRCRAALLRHFGTRPSNETERALREAGQAQAAPRLKDFAPTTGPLVAQS
jgi:DNA-binding SARP family transcriptional activator